MRPRSLCLPSGATRASRTPIVRSAAFACSLVVLPSCHVVDEARTCGRLAELVNEKIESLDRATEGGATEKNAATYETLAKSLAEIAPDDLGLARSKDALAHDFREAAERVRDAEKARLAANRRLYLNAKARLDQLSSRIGETASQLEKRCKKR